MQQARALQQSESFGEYRQRRVVVERRLARLVQLGIRQARYLGRAKTKFQLYLAATVAANRTLVAGKFGLRDGNGSVPSASPAMPTRNASHGVNFNAVCRWSICPLTLLISASPPQLHFQTRTFRPAF